VLNKTLVLDNSTFSIIGVLPAGFRYAGEPLADAPEEISVYLPLSANPLIATPRSLRFLKVAGRLAPGATVERARNELRTIGARLASEYPQSNREMQWELQPLSDEATGRYREPVFLLLGAVGCVLLLASSNVANLLLARAVERRQEMSVRAALGASAWRILRQLLAESLVLASLGGVFGTVTAILLLKVLNALGPRALMSGGSIRLDVRTLLFTAAIVIAAAVFSGLMPAWHTMTAGIGGALRAGSRSVTPGSHPFRSCLVVAQMALAVVLLVGACLLIRSFQALLNVDPGFRAQNLTTIATQLPASASTPEQRGCLNDLGVPAEIGPAEDCTPLPCGHDSETGY
jgi:predicted permease